MTNAKPPAWTPPPALVAAVAQLLRRLVKTAVKDGKTRT
jgi:hypothetical protein